jgi:hypothetical protein
MGIAGCFLIAIGFSQWLIVYDVDGALAEII